MNLERVDQIAKAVLYEGYMLYPYRPSSVKNQQRWNFGVVYPQAYSDMQDGNEPSSMCVECLVSGAPQTILQVKLRFLQLRARFEEWCATTSSQLPNGWQEAVERLVSLPSLTLEPLLSEKRWQPFSFPAETEIGPERDSSVKAARIVTHRQSAIEGCVEVAAQSIRADVFKVSIVVRNTTPMSARPAHRDEALMQSLVSTHLVLGADKGEFVSLLEPPADLQEASSQCQNVGVWPVLVGEPGQRDTVLASPIILYDYPQIAPESAGDLFDGTEIDEILSLRIMTLTDAEKREMRESDERTRQILERTEAMPAEQFMKLHGGIRSLRPVRENEP
jgi:hypothetical protein